MKKLEIKDIYTMVAECTKGKLVKDVFIIAEMMGVNLEKCSQLQWDAFFYEFTNM